MKATNFFEDFIIRTFGVFSSRTYEIHHKIAHLLSHSCSEPVEAEDSYNSGMFNELCHCKPSQAFVFSFPLGVSYLMQLQITSHSLRCAKHTIIKQNQTLKKFTTQHEKHLANSTSPNSTTLSFLPSLSLSIHRQRPC